MITGYGGRILYSDERTVLGIDLGSDFDAHHEHGIKGIVEDFGLLTEKELGYEALRNTNTPFNLWYCEKGSNSLLVYEPLLFSPPTQAKISSLMDDTLSIDRHNAGKGFVGAWDEDSFGVNVDRKMHGNVLKELYDAFTKKDVVTALRHGKFIANRGLALLIYSRIPEDEKIKYRDDDKHQREMQKLYAEMERKSGVIELLESKGKKYFYLHVRRLDGSGQAIWWLNPEEQDMYKSGWFSTKDLLDWTEDKGKIVKKVQPIKFS